MKLYQDEEKLELTERLWVTKDVKGILKKLKSDLRKQGRKVSMAKLVCNLIIEKYEGE